MPIVDGDAVLPGESTLTSSGVLTISGAGSLADVASVVATPVLVHNYAATGSGGLTLGGSSICHPKLNTPVATGGVTIGGFGLARAIAVITVTKTFLWNLRGSVTIRKKVEYQTGLQPLKWYQLEGQCISSNCSVGGVVSNDARCTGISTNSRFQTTLLGRSLEDICQQLHDRGHRWPITSIKVHSKPAEPTQVALEESQGIDHSCDTLIEIPFRQVPSCLDFAINSLATVDGVVTVTGGVVYIYQYTGSGGVVLGGSAEAGILPYRYTATGGITLGGSAEVRCTNYHYVGTGGITMGGTSGVTSSAWQYASTGGITMGGSAPVTSSSWQYPGSGTVTLGGSASTRVRLHFTSSGLAAPGMAAIRLGGSARLLLSGFQFHYTGTGGIVLGGEAERRSSAYQYTPTGGITLGGAAGVRSDRFKYVGSGGITIGGSYRGRFRYTATGGITLGGAATILKRYLCTGSGGIVIGGEALATSPVWHYQGRGGVSIGGEALARNNYLGVFLVNGEAETGVLDLRAEFGTESSAPEIPFVTGIVPNFCDCPNMPLLLNLTHNINVAGRLGEFLQRNSLTLPTTVSLIYDNVLETWRHNTHLRGLADNGGTETWNIMFDWQCANELGSFDLGSSVWKFGMLVSKRNSTGRKVEDTRVLVAFSSTNLCSNQTFQFHLTMNTRSGVIASKPIGVLNTDILYDEIGMFEGTRWLTSPVLDIEIAETLPDETGDFIDITFVLDDDAEVFVP